MKNPMSSANSDTSPRKPMSKCTPRKRPKVSSRRETAASTRNSPRHKLSRTPISCRPGEVLGVEFVSGVGDLMLAVNDGGPVSISGGGEPGRIGGMIPGSGLSLEGGNSGFEGIVAIYASGLVAS